MSADPVPSLPSFMPSLAAADSTPQPPAKLATREFNAWYGSFLALRAINFEAPTGKVTAIIGPSGCGKSTLLRSLNRMNDLIPGFHSQGGLLLDDQQLDGAGGDLMLIRRRIGMLFQRPNPFPMSVFDNVAYGLRIGGGLPKTELQDRVERALRRSALWDEVSDRLRRPAMSLSGGQQQRLCLARTLAVEPEAILMDEPTSALDPIATLRIEELMRELSGEVTIIAVTHNMQQAARVSHYTAFMLMGEGRAGELIEFGRTAQLFANPRDRRTEDYITGRFG